MVVLGGAFLKYKTEFIVKFFEIDWGPRRFMGQILSIAYATVFTPLLGIDTRQQVLQQPSYNN